MLQLTIEIGKPGCKHEVKVVLAKKECSVLESRNWSWWASPEKTVGILQIFVKLRDLISSWNWSWLWPCRQSIGEKVKWAVPKNYGRKSEQFLREKAEFLKGNIKHLLVSYSHVPGICRICVSLNLSEAFWSPFTNLIIEANWDEEILPQILGGFSGGAKRTQTQLKSCWIRIFLCRVKCQKMMNIKSSVIQVL